MKTLNALPDLHATFLQRFMRLAVCILAMVALHLSTTVQAETCKVTMGGTNFTPPAKPKITTGTSATITVFGNFVDIAQTVTASKGGVSISKSNPVSGGFTPCNTNIRLSITVGTTVSVGEMTITLRGAGGSYTASFKVDVIAPPPPLCGTAEGQLSMMLAKVVVTAPAAPTVSSTDRFGFTFNSELFKVAQPEATNTACQSAVTIEMYFAATSALLSNLSTAAANDNVEALATPAGVTKVSVTKTRTGNVFACSASIGRPSLPAGANFYRVSKRISKEGEQDPYVFSTTYSFTVVNKLPVANAGADKTITLPTNTVTIGATATDDRGIASYQWTRISGGAGTIASTTTATTAINGLAVGVHVFQQRATDSDGAVATDQVTVTVLAAPDVSPDIRADGVNQVLYCCGNGTVGDGKFTYFALPQAFCQTLPPLTSYFQEDTVLISGNVEKRVMRLDHPLPNMAIHYTNIGTGTTGIGFNVQVLKGTSSTVLATIAAPALAAGAVGSVNYTGRGTAIVYRFPGFDGTQDNRFCYVKEELDHTYNPVFTKEKDGLTISIDPARAVTTEPSTKITNNKKFITSGTSVVIR
jgi:hypothetical protein